MQCQGIESDPSSEDLNCQRDVLMAVLEVHPSHLTEAELVREYAEQPDDFRSRDAFGRAIRDLAGAGLVHRSGEFVLPTRAAVRIKELWGLIG